MEDPISGASVAPNSGSSAKSKSVTHAARAAKSGEAVAERAKTQRDQSQSAPGSSSKVRGVSDSAEISARAKQKFESA